MNEQKDFKVGDVPLKIFTAASVFEAELRANSIPGQKALCFVLHQVNRTFTYTKEKSKMSCNVEFSINLILLQW